MVAVKVQHPWIKENIKLDIESVSFFLELGKKLFKNFNYTWISDDMKTNLPKEVDFMNEVINSKKVEEILIGKNVYTPKIHEDLCSSKVLVMEFIDGYSITDTNRLQRDGIDI